MELFSEFPFRTAFTPNCASFQGKGCLLLFLCVCVQPIPKKDLRTKEKRELKIDPCDCCSSGDDVNKCGVTGGCAMFPAKYWDGEFRSIEIETWCCLLHNSCCDPGQHTLACRLQPVPVLYTCFDVSPYLYCTPRCPHYPRHE